MTKVDFKWNGSEIQRRMLKAIDLTLSDVAAEIVQDAIQSAPVFTGNLRRSITYGKPYTGRRGRGVDVGLRGGKPDEFRYAMAVEHGRQPGKRPPVDALKLWVERKWGAGRVAARSGSLTGRGSRRMKGDARQRAIDGAAFVLARHIGEHGTRPHPFLIPAWQRHVHKIQERLKARWAEIARAAI